MTEYEVSEPILNSAFEEPAKHWRIAKGEQPVIKTGRRPSSYFYVPPGRADDQGQRAPATEIELKLVNLVRRRVKEWRDNANEPYPGVSGTTRTLLQYWKGEGRQHRLFFAQLEAAETVIFLTEARADFLQGIEIPPDEPGPESQAEGARGFRRLACKMATGSGKTTVMGMLAAWSILNKVADRSSARYSDTVLIVCPNVTIRSRLAELDPKRMEASLYRTRDLVPAHLMPDLAKGRVVVTNWHVFEPQVSNVAGVSARVVRAGRREVRQERIRIGTRTSSGRGVRTMTLEDFNRQYAAGLFKVIGQEQDADGNLESVTIEAERFVESDTAVVERLLREVRGKQNILVMNDEAHHAYRIRRTETEPAEGDLFAEDEGEDFYAEATVWISGLDRIQRQRGINFCVDFSATPYFLGRVGQETNRPFPWVVSDFSLTDAIEAGLVKVPQLAVRDSTGAEIPGYFNLWKWIADRLTPAERGGAKGSAKPEAVLKWANTPIAMLGGLWQEELRQRSVKGDDPRPPVFILVCRNTRIAKVVYDWLAEDKPPFGVPPAGLPAFRNNGKLSTLRVDTSVVHETDTGQAKSDEDAWMRFTLDTVGKLDWPKDSQGRPLYPEGFEELAGKLGRPLNPPGRDVRCIVSVAMLTEGWDCNTVTHIIGLRPFTSQLLCEQVVGRGLRRFSYEVRADGRMTEEVALILGVPFEVVPFKASTGKPVETPERHHVHAIPSRAPFEITFPRVEGYRQAIRNRIEVDWPTVPTLVVDPMAIPPEVQLKATLPANQGGRPTLMGPGRIVDVSLSPFRAGRRRQELVFDLARDLTREYTTQSSCEAPPHVLFPQLGAIVERFLKERVEVKPPASLLDVFLAPYYGWVVEMLTSAIRPDTARGEAPELPRYESNRGPGSTAEVDFWTTREVREVQKSHVNYVVADTLKWEQAATYLLDRDSRVQAFVKNAGLGFAIPYLHNGQPHDYVPDFIVRLTSKPVVHLILETKGHDPLKEVKTQAAHRWVAAVNADGRYGLWAFELCTDPTQVPAALDRAMGVLGRLPATG